MCGLYIWSLGIILASLYDILHLRNQIIERFPTIQLGWATMGKC